MGSIAIWTLGIRACWKPRTPAPKHRRNLHQSSVTLAHTPTLDAGVYPGTSALDSRSLATRSKWEDLIDSLSRDRANPSRVWNIYLDLGSVMGFEAVPFEVQQQVLRKCVPGTAQLRIAAARRMQAGNHPRTPHIYEPRLQTLIGHMRASGRKPTLEDYNFVLEQFAAVGHQNGARQVFQEMTHVGVEPSYRTYCFCLQAIAHRLTLPCPFRFRSNMLDEASRMCTDLLDDMWNRRIPLTSVNFDLVHRVFKETSDRATFDKLLKVGYGIDLAYPDRLPLEGLEILTSSEKDVENTRFQPLPFSTAALNTLIDMLGKTKQISKMVLAFEVLTTPIPPSVSNPLAEQGYKYDDDDDDPAFYQFPFPGNDTPPYQPPSAVPNTTSFNLLIRYAAKANHAVFARHYVVQAMERDRAVDAQLRSELSSKSLEDIVSPNFAVNRGTFLPPFGLANRTRHFAFLRWSCKQTALALNRKRADLTFYSEWRQNRADPSRHEPENGEAKVHRDLRTLPTSDALESSDSLAESTYPASPANATDFTGSCAPHTPVIPDLPEALKVDVDAPTPLSIALRKPLDLDLHISLLTRDVEEIGILVRRMQEAVQRLSQRVKERLGRRIWQGKDIFLMSQNARVRMNRQDWVERVRFRHPRPAQIWRPTITPPIAGGPHSWQNRQDAPHIHPQKRRSQLLSEYKLT